ncbi:MAG TPA: transketolase [Thiohalobacter sp.]|nr:transketolase [Thiohalobacter sp.]
MGPPDRRNVRIDQTCIDTLRCLSIDMVQKAGSGHPGLPLGAAPMAWVLWDRFLRHNPANPDWADRDRFVLSAGHGSALLYSLLHLTGYGLGLDDIERFRQWGSKTPGHPERGAVPGVETTTGPLGQGMANAVGMALVEAQLAARYNREDHQVIDHRTWALVSDGDLMEGVAAEAASLAGHLQLGKLTCLYDDNRVTLAADTDVTFSEDRAARFMAYGWHVERVADGNDLDAIDAAIRCARAVEDRPSLLLVRTHIGYGSPGQDSYKAHGAPLGEEGVAATKRQLGWPGQPPFRVPDAARERGRQALVRGRQAEQAWQARWEAYHAAYPGLATELARSLAGELTPGWDADIPEFPAGQAIASRAAGGKVLGAIAPRLPLLSGGSADLDPSTNTFVPGLGSFGPTPDADRAGPAGEAWSPAGRNIHFGVREHAMGAIANGMAAHGGFIPYTATFMVFSDYMRPPMRLAALMRLHVIHVFTHDSIAVGEDGPTHQPVEQLAGLRSVPYLNVIRPGDANETAEAWRVAIETRDRPTALVLSRQGLPTLDRGRYACAEGLRRGGYILKEAEGGPPGLILIASGSELALAVEAAETLTADGQAVRVVSLPSWELFDSQPQGWRDEVLPPGIGRRLAIEAGVSQGWHRYVGDHGTLLTVDRFGASAPGQRVLEEYGFTVDQVVAMARALVDSG